MNQPQRNRTMKVTIETKTELRGGCHLRGTFGLVDPFLTSTSTFLQSVEIYQLGMLASKYLTS